MGLSPITRKFVDVMSKKNMYALICPQYRILSIATFDYPLCWLGAAIRWGVLVESVQVQSVNICVSFYIEGR